MQAHVQSEMPPPYAVEADVQDEAVIQQALAILRRRMVERQTFGSPGMVKDFLQLKLARSECEQFAVLFLDSQHGLIHEEVMFRGTLTQTSVYPREVVKRALELNAGAVVLAHNHPSGSVEPSSADEQITQVLKKALALIDVRVLDHIVVAPGRALSLAERGLV